MWADIDGNLKIVEESAKQTKINGLCKFCYSQ